MKIIVCILSLSFALLAQSPARPSAQSAKQVNLPPVPPPLAIPAGQVCVSYSSDELTAIEWARLNERGPAKVDAQGNLTQSPAHADIQSFVEYLTRGYAGTDPKVNATAIVQQIEKVFGPDAIKAFNDAKKTN